MIDRRGGNVPNASQFINFYFINVTSNPFDTEFYWIAYYRMNKKKSLVLLQIAGTCFQRSLKVQYKELKSKYNK